MDEGWREAEVRRGNLSVKFVGYQSKGGRERWIRGVLPMGKVRRLLGHAVLSSAKTIKDMMCVCRVFPCQASQTES